MQPRSRSLWTLGLASLGREQGAVERAGAGDWAGLGHQSEAGPQRKPVPGSWKAVWTQLPPQPQPAMGLPLPWLSRCCCRLLPSRIMGPHTSRGAYSQNTGPPTGKLATEETRKTLSPNRDPGHRSAELAQAEELLEQQLELYQALLEGQEGAWEAQALVLKIQKLKEQMRRHRESLRGDA